MYTKYYTKEKGSKIAKDRLNYSIFPIKSNRKISNPKALIRTTPRVKTAFSKQNPQIPKNDAMFNLAMSNMIKFQDAIATRPIIANCLSMSNIEDKKNEDKYLNDSNDLIQRCYNPEPLPQKVNNNENDPSHNYHQNKSNDRKLLYTLKTLDLENLFIAFNLNAITFNDLFLLLKEDLLELRIPLGPRNRILHFAEEYKKTAKDYDFKELTEFFQRNKCFLINHVQDFSCSNIAGYEKKKEKNILLSPKGNSRQPNSNIVNHIASLNNVSSINLNSNLNMREDNEISNSNSNNNQRSNRLVDKANNYQQIDNENDKDSENSKISLLKGLSCTNSQQNTFLHNENNSVLPKKTINSNNFFYQNNNNNSPHLLKDKDKEDKRSKHLEQKHDTNNHIPNRIPIHSFNQSTSLLNTNHNIFNNNLQTVPLTIENIEEPIHRSGSELFENSQNNTQSISFYENKESIPNKSDLSTNLASMQTTNQKIKNKTQLIQNFQNIFIEVEQFQHQYESMKQKNDQRKTRINSLMTRKKDNNSHNKVNYTQPRNSEISLGKEDLNNESERNLNDELSKLYDSEIKTSSNTSSQQYKCHRTNSNKDNNSRFVYESDFQTQK